MTQLIPVPKTPSEAALQVPVVVDDLGLDNEGVIQAAKELGMVVSPAKLIASHRLGKAINKTGVLKIGRSRLLKCMDEAESGLEISKEVLGKLTDVEMKASLLPTHLGLIKECRESAVAFTKTAELGDTDGDDKKRSVKPFGAGQPAGPVTVIAQQAVVTTNTSQSQ